MANLNELLFAIGIGKQTNIATANTATLWRVPSQTRKMIAQRTVTETDADEVGKGHEFATTEYASHYDNPPYTVERPCSSELLAWMFAFLLGATTKTGSSAPWTYTSTPMSLPTAGDELPYFSMVQQMRPGASSIVDQLFTGCALKGARISVKSIPGRQSATLSFDVVTSGPYVEPSAVTIPAQPAWHEMQMSSLSLTVNGTDYVANQGFVSLDIGWDNNFRPGFFPGSGSQDGFAVQGRLEVGNRAPSFVFVIRAKHGTPELTAARSLSTGTAVIGLSNPAGDSWTATWQKLSLATAELSDENGVVTIQVTGMPQYDATNGIFSSVTVCSVNGICQ
jgi:hypothetical protein